MREYGSNIILPSLDNLFSSEQERQDAKLEKIQILPLSELHPFEGHAGRLCANRTDHIARCWDRADRARNHRCNVRRNSKNHGGNSR